MFSFLAPSISFCFMFVLFCISFRFKFALWHGNKKGEQGESFPLPAGISGSISFTLSGAEVCPVWLQMTLRRCPLSPGICLRKKWWVLATSTGMFRVSHSPVCPRHIFFLSRQPFSVSAVNFSLSHDRPRPLARLKGLLRYANCLDGRSVWSLTCDISESQGPDRQTHICRLP